MTKTEAMELIGQAWDAQDRGDHDLSDALFAQVKFAHWQHVEISDVVGRAVEDDDVVELALRKAAA